MKNIIQKIAFVMVLIGIAGMDSDKLLIPAIMTITGAIALFITSTNGQEEK